MEKSVTMGWTEETKPGELVKVQDDYYRFKFILESRNREWVCADLVVLPGCAEGSF